MITKRTRMQLIAFVIITLLGVSYVGAKYARLDRLFTDDTYTVVAHFADSGGAFVGALVTYRGVTVGRIEDMEVTRGGVDVALGIERSYDQIPADARALVGNRSAVGEQYVELQPQTDAKPYLREGAEIAQADTALPISTTQLLGNLSETVESVDQRDLRTVVGELGLAFGGAGRDLSTIIDSSNRFIGTANENFDVTTALIRDGNTVLRGQIASARNIRVFAKRFRQFSGAMVGADQDLRRVIDNGSATANQLRRFLEDNEVDLAELLNNLVTTGEVVVRRLDGVEQILALYPYVVEGGFTVVAKTASTGQYDAHFGLVLTEHKLCHRGYEGTDRRPPQDGSNRPMAVNARCTEPASATNARGAQHAPNRAGALTPVAAYDPATRDLTWGDSLSAAGADRPGPATLGEETWKWLYLQPLTSATVL